MVVAETVVASRTDNRQVVKGYKFVTSSMRSRNGDIEWEAGLWQVHEGPQVFCKSGFHFSRTAHDSLQHVLGDRWFEVEARGNILDNTDESNAQEMRLMREIDVKKVALRFAIACARRSLHYFEDKYPDDKRPRQAIEAAEKYEKDPSEARRSAAWSAAWSAAGSAAESASRSAAWSAAESAWSAAESAAGSAAESASRSAAWSASRSASRSAAWSAELQWQRETLDQIIADSFKEREEATA